MNNINYQNRLKIQSINLNRKETVLHNRARIKPTKNTAAPAAEQPRPGPGPGSINDLERERGEHKHRH